MNNTIYPTCSCFEHNKINFKNDSLKEVMMKKDKQTIDDVSSNTCDDCQMINAFVLNMAITVRWIERLNLFEQSFTNFALRNKRKTGLMVLLII